VAAAMTVLELGSDIGGSIRIPSNWCGVCGHKPTWGIVPQRGHMPPAPGTLADTDLNVVGPIARSVDDLELTLDVVAGAHGHQAAGWRLDLPEARATALRDLRLAAWLDDPTYPPESEIRRVLGQAVDTLRGAGARIADTHPAVELPEVVRTYQQLLYPILLGTMAQESFDGFVALASQLPGEDDGGLARSVRFATLRHRDWLFAHERREKMRATMADFFRDVDALLMPVTIVPAIPHDHSEPFTDRVIRADGGERPYTDLFGWIALTTLAYLPATVVPVGRTRDGLPIGVQIVGPYLEDRTTLAVGRCVSEVLGGFAPPPAASRP